MKFSIVIPSFNQSPHLPIALDSVFAQETTNTELIVKDGGSTDGTVEILSGRRESFRWSSYPNRGKTDAINEGLREATGDIVGYLNPHDCYLPGALAAVAAHFHEHPDCQILYGDAYHLQPDGSVKGEHPTQDWSYSELLMTNYVCPPTVFWRRALLDRIGYFDERLSAATDYEYWLRAGAEVPFTRLKANFLASTRVSAETLTLEECTTAHREMVGVVRQYSENPRPVVAWLRRLATVSAAQSGFPPSDAPGEHQLHLQLVVSWLLHHASDLQVRLDAPVLEELEELVEQAVPLSQ